MITDEEFEKIWADCKARDASLEAEWNALPEEEKKRRLEMYDPDLIERMTDDITGGSDD